MLAASIHEHAGLEIKFGDMFAAEYLQKILDMNGV